MDKKSTIEKALEWVKLKANVSIKAVHEDYEEPKVFKNKVGEGHVQPDISYTTESAQVHYVEVVDKTKKVSDIVTKWKLLSLMASMKRGKLHLLAPKGQKTFTQNLIKEHDITASIISI